MYRTFMVRWLAASPTAFEGLKCGLWLGHCLEAIRQSIMCVPDLTPRSVYWKDEERSNIAVNPSVEQECLDWSLLNEWMEMRTYTLNDLREANPPEP